MGSSPRVWGQVDTDYNNSLANRIIPTRVGTSILIDEIGTILKDHPHACGDKSGLKVLFMIVIGSSPRVWGQGSSNHLYSQLTRDHPHACGDKLRNCVLFSVNIRIIPTRVGTSVSDDMTFLKKEDHPHACGDKFHDALFSNSDEGSSPRVWGQVCHFHQLP